ncbi:MAG: dihydroorotate oxidase [Vulcanisaeta sp.]|nr:dihydroorotate oxidase [Vulcanisaeta sp.]
MLPRVINYLPPDITHDISHAIIRAGIAGVLRIGMDYPAEVFGVRFRNPLGLGAGIDKDGLLINGLARSGVGFVTIGSVTLKPRRGNPRPRIVKYPGLKAMVNAMGLPSRGFADFITRLGKVVDLASRFGVRVIVSLAGFSLEEFLVMLSRLRGFGIDAVEVNISSPTYRGSWLNDINRLGDLLRAIEGFDKPLFIKVPLGAGVDFYRWITETAERYGYGLTIANTLPIKEPRISVGYGGLSGYPIYPLVRALIRKVRTWGFRGPIIGIGGVFHGWQVTELLKSGANLVGVVTAFAFEGPIVFMRLLREFYAYLSSQ